MPIDYTHEWHDDGHEDCEVCKHCGAGKTGIYFRDTEPCPVRVIDILAATEARAEKAEAKAQARAAVLRGIQWVRDCLLLKSFCPSCEEEEPAHTQDCALAAALRED